MRGRAMWLATILMAMGAMIVAGCAFGPKIAYEPFEAIIDNSSLEGFVSEGEWTSEQGMDGFEYGDDSLWAWANPDEKDVATWTPELPYDGRYEVFVWYSADPKDDHNEKAPFIVTSCDGEQKIEVNLKKDYGQWNSLGVFEMKKGSESMVKTHTAAGGNGIADAVKFVFVKP